MSSSQADATYTELTTTEPAMASSSAGSRQTPPPCTPPTPMTSQEGKTQSPDHSAKRERGTRGRGKSGTRGKQTENMEVFDKVYNKKGKVQVFPDFVESKVTLYKRVTPARPPPPAGAVRDAHCSREQTTPSTATERSTGQSSNVSTDSQQQGEQKEAAGSAESLGGTLQDKNAAAETPGLSSRRNIEASSGGKDGDSGDQTKTKKIRINEPPSYALDEYKLRNPNIAEHLESEYYEFLVVQLVKAVLEEIMDPDDPPVFLFHNQDLSSKAGNGKSGEKDVLVLHPHLGVLLLEVKAVKNKDAFSRFDEATAQLLHAKESVLKEMGDLLETDAVVLTIALPKMEPEDSTIISQKAKERLSTKPGSDITDATSASSVTSSTAGHREGSIGRKSGGVGGSGGDRDPKLKEGALLGNHPEIHLVCGPTAEVLKQWVTQLQHLRATTSHAFKGCTPQERLENFKTAFLRRCSVAGLRPGQSLKARADLHHRFLLTEEQLRVQDSQAELLHISGPCGSGKTLLLAERARRWLREGRRVALAAGEVYYHDVLLRHLVNSVCGDKSVAGVSTHIAWDELLEWLDTLSTEDTPVSIIGDEASHVHSSYSSLLHHVAAGRVRGLWTACSRRLEHNEEKELESLGGSTVHLSLCLRCPPHVRAWINNLKEEDDPPLLPPPVPVTRELGEGVQVICHPDHPQRQSWHTCTRCKEEVTAFFSSLGLLGDGATSALKLSDVVVITIDLSCDTERVARWLRGLGLHAVAEGGTRTYRTPVLPPGVTPTSRDHAEAEAYRQRVLKGNDDKGKPAVHVVWCGDFTGLEKPVVLLWHEDEEDEDRDLQGQEARKGRMERHRYFWFQAASRCQGRLLVMVATPSPLLPLLPATSPPEVALTQSPQESSTATASSHSGVTSASPAPPASHHFPVSSSSLGGEPNPHPSTPPE